jgi:hypothetical protein
MCVLVASACAGKLTLGCGFFKKRAKQEQQALAARIAFSPSFPFSVESGEFPDLTSE